MTAHKIILANNGHLESFGISQGSLMQLFLYASMTPELSKEDMVKLGGAPRWGITPSDPMGTTMRRIDTDQGGNRIITREPITINQVKARILAPDTATAGDKLAVGWDGPGYHRDYIGLFDSNGNRITYEQTNRGNPLELQLPDTAGTYEVRYVMRSGEVILARQSVTVN